MKYVLPLVSLVAISSTIYAFSIETDPKIILEKENREKVIKCLENVYAFTWDTQSLQKEIERCSKLKLQYIYWTGELAPSSEPPSWKIALDSLHKKVCQKQVNSPLCKDKQLFDRLYQITEERLPWKNFYPILLGITNAESSLGLNFAHDNTWGTCAGRNNWWGIKWKKTDDWASVKDQGIPDSFGCYLYKFDSVEDYWISKVNTIRFWYKWCVDSKTPIRCMSYAYVWDRYVSEDSWVRNVSIFLN